MEPVITSVQNDFVKMVRSLKEKKYRTKLGLFAVEGNKCVDELISFRPDLIKDIIITGENNDKYIQSANQLNCPIHFVTPHVMNAICECKTAQSVAAIAAIPAYQNVAEGFIVALDDVLDPQNVGTIIRTADAAGCSAVVLSNSSADCYSAKAVRASMGSIFHLPVIYTQLAGYLETLKRSGYHIACADMDGASEYALDWSGTCLVIGNEAKGVSSEIYALSTEKICIPMYGKAESLNAAVAAGILIYKIRS